MAPPPRFTVTLRPKRPCDLHGSVASVAVPAVTPRRTLNVVHVAVEMAPIAKVRRTCVVHSRGDRNLLYGSYGGRTQYCTDLVKTSTLQGECTAAPTEPAATKYGRGQ